MRKTAINSPNKKQKRAKNDKNTRLLVFPRRIRKISFVLSF
jgi:hypothetical protein